MKTLTGVFDSPADAERARATLLEAGVAAERITVSRDLYEDDIAGEAPGQSFENQPGQAPEDSAAARAAEAARSRSCVVHVVPQSEEEVRLVQRLFERDG